MTNKFLAWIGLLVTVGGMQTNAFAWGHSAHQILAEVGSQLTPAGSQFWTANSKGMGFLTNVPDMDWKRSTTADAEKPNHWFQPDSYFKLPDQFDQFPHPYSVAQKRFGDATLKTNGTAPWRIRQFYDLALTALKKNDYATALEMAGAMSHYIGDLSQPLHVTKNFDGQETNEVGIHKYFETDNIESSDKVALQTEVLNQAKKLLADPQFLARFNGSIVDSVFREINVAYSFKDEILATDKKLGRGPEGGKAQLQLAIPRMADGAATLAVILSRLWKDAGNPSANGASVAVVAPFFVAPLFTDEVPAGASVVPLVEQIKLAALQDDCDR